MYDYRASLQGLSERIRKMRADGHRNDWSRPEAAKQFESVATDLERLAERIGTEPFAGLKQAFDAGDGGEAGEARAGRFEALRMQMCALADTARSEAESMLDPLQRKDLERCADLFVHLRFECEMSDPTLSPDSDAIADLAEVFERAGIMLSRKTLNELLDNAVSRFDACEIPDGLAGVLTLRG